jgi:hypothetical protein
MTEEIETTLSTENGVRVTVSEWDEDSVWLYLAGRGASMSTVLTRTEALALVAGLQEILAKPAPEPKPQVDPNKWAFDNGLESF